MHIIDVNLPIRQKSVSWHELPQVNLGNCLSNLENVEANLFMNKNFILLIASFLNSSS